MSHAEYDAVVIFLRGVKVTLEELKENGKVINTDFF
jgi:hypothetical protein